MVFLLRLHSDHCVTSQNHQFQVYLLLSLHPFTRHNYLCLTITGLNKCSWGERFTCKCHILATGISCSIIYGKIELCYQSAADKHCIRSHLSELGSYDSGKSHSGHCHLCECSKMFHTTVFFLYTFSYSYTFSSNQFLVSICQQLGALSQKDLINNTKLNLTNWFCQEVIQQIQPTKVKSSHRGGNWASARFLRGFCCCAAWAGVYYPHVKHKMVYLCSILKLV